MERLERVCVQEKKKNNAVLAYCRLAGLRELRYMGGNEKAESKQN